MTMTVQLQPDGEGYFGRECPACEKYFKVRLGTGLPDQPNCHCPYCSHLGDHSTFFTRQQNDAMAAAALKFVSGMLTDSLEALAPAADQNGLISIGISVRGQQDPIACFPESDLEVRVSCSACTLEYKIYGAYCYCPECGVLHSQEIVLANFALVTRMLDLAATSEESIKATLIGNALDEAVSAFDGFGREHCRGPAGEISFQNLDAARVALLDIAAGIAPDAWQFLRERWQQRQQVALTDSEGRTLVAMLAIVAASLNQERKT